MCQIFSKFIIFVITLIKVYKLVYSGDQIMAFKGEEKFYGNDFLGYNLTDGEKDLVNDYTALLMNPNVHDIEIGIDAFFANKVTYDNAGNEVRPEYDHIECLAIAKERARAFSGREPIEQYKQIDQDRINRTQLRRGSVDEVVESDNIIQLEGLEQEMNVPYESGPKEELAPTG